MSHKVENSEDFKIGAIKTKYAFADIGKATVFDQKLEIETSRRNRVVSATRTLKYMLFDQEKRRDLEEERWCSTSKN